MTDAAHHILTRPSRSCTGLFFLDEEVLREADVRDFSIFPVDLATDLSIDYFVEP
jgi:citronellol/citronellal dehydrogenase